MMSTKNLSLMILLSGMFTSTSTWPEDIFAGLLLLTMELLFTGLKFIFIGI